MKLRTIESLSDAIDKELQWRYKEIINLSLQVKSTEGQIRHTLKRSSIAIIYAHWEGFVKASATFYLNFVLNRRQNYADLKPNFLAIKIHSKFNQFSETKKTKPITDTIKEIQCLLNRRTDFSTQGIIDTESNLKSTVLNNILNTTGITTDVFKLTEHFIDHTLVNYRNQICHGEGFKINDDEFFEIKDKVLDLLKLFRNVIENSSCTKEYTL